jgi:hypothetical protein
MRRSIPSLTAACAVLAVTGVGTAVPASAAPSRPAIISPAATNWGHRCVYRVTANGVRIRSGPGTSYTIVDQVNAGAEIIAYSGGTVRANGYTWRFVTSDFYAWGQGFGWIANKYLTLLSNPC